MPGTDSLELRALDEHKVPDTLQTLLMLENWLLHHAAADSFWEEPHLFIRPIVAITADVQRRGCTIFTTVPTNSIFSRS